MTEEQRDEMLITVVKGLSNLQILVVENNKEIKRTIEELQKEIQEVEKRLQIQIDELKKEVSELRNDVQKLKEDVANLKEEVAELKVNFEVNIKEIPKIFTDTFEITDKRFNKIKRILNEHNKILQDLRR